MARRPNIRFCRRSGLFRLEVAVPWRVARKGDRFVRPGWDEADAAARGVAVAAEAGRCVLCECRAGVLCKARVSCGVDVFLNHALFLPGDDDVPCMF